MQPPFPLRNIWPEVIDRLRNLLTESGELDLAAGVDGLRVYDRCRCAEDECVMVHTQPRSNRACGPTHRTVVFRGGKPMDLDPGKKVRDTSTTIVDVVDDVIVCIEILGDRESRKRLIVALPDLPEAAK